MAQEFIEYKVIVDLASGQAKFEQLSNSVKKSKKDVDDLGDSLTKTGKKAGQGADKMGLAGAAITELGRTISDSNYGMTAMANNLQQLSTLLVTLFATTKSASEAIGLLWKAVTGPLGVILIFQTMFKFMEKTAIEAKSAAKSTNDMLGALNAQLAVQKELYDRAVKRGEATDEILIKEREIAELKRTELQILLLELEAKRSEAFLDAQKLTFLESIQGKSAEITAEELAAIQALDSSISEVELKLLQIDDFLKKGGSAGSGGGGGGNNKKRKLDLVETIDVEYEFKQAEIFLDAYVEVYGKLADRIKKQLEPAHEASKNAIKEFLDSNDVIEAAEIKRRQGEEESAKLTAKWLGVIREEHIMTWQAVGDAMSSMSSILGEQTKAGKAIAVAGALIDTYSAIAKTLNAFAGKPIPGYAIAQSIAIGLFGMAQVKKILSVPVPGGKGGGSAGSMAAPTQAPTFNIVGTSGASQLREAVEGGLNRPIKAYVTQKDISTSAELERSTRKTASII